MAAKHVLWFLSLVGAVVLTGAGRSAAEPAAPRGPLATVDAQGCVAVSWAYPGSGEMAYSASSGSKSKAYYISRSAGAHQLACKFVLSAVTQWVGTVEVWIEAGPGESEHAWDSRAGLAFSLAADSTGVPGLTLSGPQEVFAGEQGIPSSGGYLRVGFDLADAPETLWVVLTWPVQDSALTRVGIDDQPKQGNALFRIGTPSEAPWQPWPEHNPMIVLRTLAYSSSCHQNTVQEVATIAPRAESPNLTSFVIGREAECADQLLRTEHPYTVVPGSQQCATDSMVFVGCSYEYDVRAVELFDTSTSSRVRLTIAPGLSCQWDPPIPIEFSSADPIHLYCTLRNNDQIRVRAAFTSGLLQSADSDSLPMRATPGYTELDPGQDAVFELFVDPLPEGEYQASARFIVSAETAVADRWELRTPIQVSGPVGVMEAPDLQADSRPQLLLFPNPAGSTAEVSAALSGFTTRYYTIETYDVLGRRIGERTISPGEADTGPLRMCVPLNNYGNPVPPGVYFIRVGGEERSICRKLVIVQ